MATAVQTLPPPSVPISRVPYLPGLDGMRALAVLSVMVYHANSTWLSGGFLGVEVFFIISGYLITLLLIAEHERSGTVSLRQFWLRRARRLLPALFTMMALVMVACALFMRDELGKLRGDIIAGVAYVSNWYQIWTGAGYTASAEFAPLRHLWSLAVEEQFYLLWPLVMIVILRRGRARLPRIGAWLFGIALLIAIGTAVLYKPGVIGTASSTPDQYFNMFGRHLTRTDTLYLSTITRAGGILMGAGFAMWWRPYAVMRSPLRNRAPMLDVVALGGLAVLAILMWQLHVTLESNEGLEGDALLFRGGFLLTGLVTIAVIAAVTHMRSFSGRVLGNRLFNWIGLRSYGLYLYHWPVYQFIRKEAGIGLTVPKFAVAMLVTFGITELSYRYIETPIRTGRLADWVQHNLRGRPTPQAALRRRRALAGGVLALALPVFAGISLAFAPLRQSDVAESLATGRDSVTNVLRDVPSAPPSTRPSIPVTEPPSDAVATPSTTASTASTELAPTSDPNATLPVVADPNATTAPPPTEPPTTTTAAPARAFDVLAIGDSVMLGAAPALTAKGAVVDALVNRQGMQGAEIVEALAADGLLPNVLVIHLGTNGPASQATLDRIITAAASVPFILVLTVRADRNWTADNNQRIRDLEVRYPGQVRLLDWATVSDMCVDNCFYGDNIHLRPAGQQFYADLVWAAIGR
jgi:peptidoglycan/LPS O-acetylase OafA/YrhL